MTGEVTLRGQVLPVGGIKEKVLAARRAGVSTFILPARNEADLDDVPEELRDKMRFVSVDTIAEVLSVSLPDEFHEVADIEVDLGSEVSQDRIAAAAHAN